jgi:hypothetical protein
VSVSEWPSYLLKRVPEDLRISLSDEAKARDYSLADLIREILCSHYGLECERRRNPKRTIPIGYGEHGNRDILSPTLLLKLQPELWEKIKADESAPTRREVMLGILEAHYEEKR